MRCSNGHEVAFGLLHCQECGRRVGAANLPAAQVRQTMPGDHASGKVDGGRWSDQGTLPRGRGRTRWIRWVSAVVLISLIGVAAAFAVHGHRGAGAAPQTPVQEPGSEARIGDCYSELPHIENPTQQIKDQRIDHVTVTPCAHRHMAEVFARFDLSRELGRSFPGYDTVERAAQADCVRAFARQRPAAGIARTAVTWTSMTPGHADVYTVDPSVTCVAYLSSKALVQRILQPGHAVTS